MNLDSIRTLLSEQDFDEIFQFWNILPADQKQDLLNQVQSINWNTLKQQQELLVHQPDSKTLLEPFLDYSYAGNKQDYLEGLEKISRGEMGCLILAGGQGSRLNSKDPKGTHPVSIVHHKSLFEIFCEKILAAEKLVGRRLLLSIMVSPSNEKATKQFFYDHNFFGLDPNQVFFFTQGTLPFLDSSGNLFLETPSTLAVGPNGNGLWPQEFVNCGIWSKWHQMGIRYVNMILVDNPLADPFDAELLGFHCRRGVDMTSKSIEKKVPEEKVGVFVKDHNTVRVIEYSEMDDQEKTSVVADGGLKHRCASISLFCFSMDFVSKLAEKKDLPLHKAWKAVDKLYHDGVTHHTSRPNAWKFETFIFDVMKYTDKIAALLYPREHCFAPLKNGSGDNSIDTVQQALQRRDREIIRHLTGKEPPLVPFELAADFYYPTPELISKWKNKTIEGGYIEP